jgi:hypothetical protein
LRARRSEKSAVANRIADRAKVFPTNKPEHHCADKTLPRYSVIDQSERNQRAGWRCHDRRPGLKLDGMHSAGFARPDSIVTDERWRALKQKVVALLHGDYSANLPNRNSANLPSYVPHAHFHLHLHENVEYRARRTRRLTDRAAYLRASDEATLAYLADLTRSAASTSDPHLKHALTRIAARTQAEVDAALDAANVIHDSFKLAVERATVRKISQMRRLSSER